MPEPQDYRTTVPVAGVTGSKMSQCVCVVGQCDRTPADKKSLRDMVVAAAEGAWSDFKLTNSSTAGKAAKVAGGVVVGGAVAKEFGVLTPLRWLARGFGPIPLEFTKSGAIQVFELSAGQRLGHVALAAGAKFALVTIAYEGGVLVGSIINQFLPEDTRDSIGGMINEIVNEQGYKELWKHPFGIGMY